METKCHDMGCAAFQNDVEGTPILSAKENFTFQCTEMISLRGLLECREALCDCSVGHLPENVITGSESDIQKLLHSVFDMVALPPLNHLAQQFHKFRRDIVGIRVIGKDSTIPHTYTAD